MPKLFGKLLAVLAFGWVGSASAGHIPVTVNGQQWLQPSDFINLTWSGISQVCAPSSGLCAGELNGIDVTGYTWASISDLHSLFNHYVGTELLGPGHGQHAEYESNWAPAFFADGWVSVYGDASLNRLTGGVVRDSYFTAKHGQLTYLSYLEDQCCDPEYAALDVVSADTDVGPQLSVGSSYSSVGAWFFRDQSEPPTEASTPATVSLLGLGLAALGYSRRKLKQGI